jgi:putative endopeptidase
MKFRTLTLATASLLAAAAPASLNAAKPVLGTWGYDQTAMNSSVKPGDDFWAYVNGNWANRTQIPADRASVGSFINLAEGAERDVRQIAEGFTNAPKRDLLGQQIGDYYSSFLDEARIEQLGTAPLKPYLSKIEAAKTRDQLVRLFSLSDSVDAGPAQPRLLPLGLTEDGGIPGRLSRLYRQDREACGPRRR